MSETPLEYLPKLTQDLPGRRIRLSNYGLILRREGVVRQGGNRVWYINKDWMSVGNWLTKEIDTLIETWPGITTSAVPIRDDSSRRRTTCQGAWWT